MTVAKHRTTALTEDEAARALRLLQAQDENSDGLLDFSEIVVVKGKERDSLLSFFADETMDKTSWADWLAHQKKLKGPQEFPKYLEELEAQLAELQEARKFAGKEWDLAIEIFNTLDQDRKTSDHTLTMEDFGFLTDPRTSGGYDTMLEHNRNHKGAKMSLQEYREALNTVRTQYEAQSRSFPEFLDHAHQMMKEYRETHRDYRLEKVFDLFDCEKTGHVPIQELDRLSQCICQAHSQEWSEARIRDSLRKMDTHKTGKVEKEEFTEFFNIELPFPKWHFDEFADEFMRLGKLHAQEYAAAKELSGLTEEEARRAHNLFIAMDRDQSGKLQVEEIVIVRDDAKQLLVDVCDNDKDGSVDQAEWKTFMLRMKKHLSGNPKFPQWLLYIEELLQKHLQSVSPVPTSRLQTSAVRQGWERGRRTPRKPRTPRSNKKQISESLQDYKDHTDWILAVLLVKDRNMLISASQDKTAKAFDIDTGKCLFTCVGHAENVQSLAVDGNTLITGSIDGTVREWSLDSGDLIRTALCHAPGKGVAQLVLLPQQRIATASRDNTAVLWDRSVTSSSQNDVDESEERESDTNTTTHTEADGTVVTVTQKVTKTTRMISSLSITEEFVQWQELTKFEGHTRWVTCLDSAADSLFTGSTDASVRQWDLSTGKETRKYDGHTQEVTSVKVNGTQLYSASREGNAKLWNISTGDCLQSFLGHLSVIRDMALGPLGGRLYTASADGTVKCWQPDSDKCLFTITGHEMAVTAVTVNNDQVFTGSSDCIVRRFAIQDDLASP